MTISATQGPFRAGKNRKPSKLTFLSSNFCLLLTLLPFFLLPLIHHLPPRLPPRLTPLLSHTKATYPPKEINDWKRPLTITAHATRHKSKIRLTLFTTGVHTHTYGRVFPAIGCKIGSVTVPNIPELDRPSITVCDIDPSILVENAPLTVLLEHNVDLKNAIKEPQKSASELFEIHLGDITVLPRVKREGLPQDLAAIKTAVTWKPGMIDLPTGERYEFCAMTAMRQYPFLLEDWIKYYRRMGVDYFYIYENNAEVPLRRYVDGRFAEVVHWPWSRSQMQSNNHFLLVAKNRCKFVAFFDADEFAMIVDGKKGALKRYVKHRDGQGYKQIIFHFLMMVNNGYVRRPKGSLPDLYTRREKDQKVKLGKAVINMDVPWYTHKIHMVAGKGNELYWNSTMELNPMSLDHNAMLVHYTKRSWEDYCAKHATGGASVMTTGRPKKVLDLDKPDAAYMNQEYEEFSELKKRWKQIVRTEDDGRILLVRRGQKKWKCTKYHCLSCIFRMTRTEVCIRKD